MLPIKKTQRYFSETVMSNPEVTSTFQQKKELVF